jgi:cytochrome bd-type quinol oxidase subunit 2
LRKFDDSKDGRERFLRGLLIVLSSGVLASVLLLVVLSVAGILLVFAGNTAIPASDDTRSFVVGAVVIVALFQLGQRIAVWRWISWDIRERRALRRDPGARPHRNWIRLQAILMGVLALLGAILVAFGNKEGTGLIGDRGPWLFAFVAGLLFVVIVSIGKDVVDSDIDVVDKDSTIVPDRPGPSAG